MNRIDDERVRFYLRHRELIEAWAAVRKDVQQTAHAFYMSLADDLGERAGGYGEDVTVWSSEWSYSKVGLYRAAWLGEEEPVVQVCLEWTRQATFSDGTRFIGVRVHWDSDQGKELRPFLGDELRELRDIAGFSRRSNHWPAYQFAPSPDGEFWVDLSGYREQLVDIMEMAWSAFADPVSQAVSKWRGSPP